MKTIITRARVSITFFNLCRFSSASSSVCFNHQFTSGIVSCSSSTRIWAFTINPFAPLARNFWKVLHILCSIVRLKKSKMVKLYSFIDGVENKNNLLGHACVLHSSCIVASPRHTPPFDSSVFFVLELVRKPPPQDVEHSPCSQAFHSQSTITKFAFYYQWDSLIKVEVLSM